ncbi:MAG: SMP-30/gluconolaconase/LRE domain protein, partial [Paenibacillus sp.]|nr:SMP-30/gluconolaconase/LRE domain protein [Paenibacillus sp.]
VTEAGAVPDGMTSDAEGMLWGALWGGGGIRRWNPHTGELLLKLDIPASLCTSCVFAGPGLNDLYITSAKVGISPEQLAEQPHAGSLFIYKTDIKGMPTHAFGG